MAVAVKRPSAFETVKALCYGPGGLRDKPWAGSSRSYLLGDDLDFATAERKGYAAGDEALRSNLSKWADEYRREASEVMRLGEGASSTQSTVTPVGLPAPADAFRDAYERIGHPHGPYASVEGTRREIEFWRTSGRLGVFWLIGRVRYETDTQVLVAAADILSDIGETAFDPLLYGLENRPSPEQAFCLLRAIAGFQPIASANQAYRLNRAIERFLKHADVDVREAAVSATHALPRQFAIDLLASAQRSEDDSVIALAIDEEIAARSNW